MYHLLTSVENLACGGHYCIRNIEFFIVCTVFDGECTTRFNMMMDPSSSGGDLTGTGLIEILIPVDLIIERVLTVVLYRSDPDYLISSYNLFPIVCSPRCSCL